MQQLNIKGSCNFYQINWANRRNYNLKGQAQIYQQKSSCPLTRALTQVHNYYKKQLLVLICFRSGGLLIFQQRLADLKWNVL